MRKEFKSYRQPNPVVFLAKVTFLFLWLVVLSAISVSAQGKKYIKKTKIERVYNTTNTLERIDFYSIGVIKGKLVIQVVKNTDLFSNEKTNFLKFKFYAGSTSGTKEAVLEGDEISSLIRSLKLMRNRILPSVSETYSEIVFESKWGFKAGCFSIKKNKKWRCYLKLEKYDDKSYIRLKPKHFLALYDVISQAEEML